MNLNEKKIIITGDSGMVGSNLKKKLNEYSSEIIPLSISDGIDLREKSDIPSFEDIDIIFHLAAKMGVPYSYEHPRDMISSNFDMTLNMLEVAREHNPLFVYTSSYLYGEPEYLPVDEEHELNPHSPYTQSKLLCEKLIEGYVRDFDIKSIIVRPFNLYGPGLAEGMLMRDIIDQLESGKIELKNPVPKRDYLYVDDITELLIDVVKKNETDFEIVNAGYGESYSVKEVAEMFKEIAGTDDEIEFENTSRKGEVLDIKADVSKAKSQYEWEPNIDLRSGIEKMLTKEGVIDE